MVPAITANHLTKGFELSLCNRMRPEAEYIDPAACFLDVGSSSLGGAQAT